MPKYFKNLNRIIDANINRLKEALRVLEEIARFVLESKTLTKELKCLRHDIEGPLNRMALRASLIKERDIESDVGKDILGKELERRNYQDIFFANTQRSKESMRVLEEFSKLLNKKTSLKFKQARYKLYAFEKKALKKLLSLSNSRY